MTVRVLCSVQIILPLRQDTCNHTGLNSMLALVLLTNLLP